MRAERTLKAWAEMYPDEMAEMLAPSNHYFEDILGSQGVNLYKVFWQYLLDTQWNRMVLNPMHYIEQADIVEINTMSRRVQNKLFAKSEMLKNKWELAKTIQNRPLSVSDNYDITKEGTDTISNHSFTDTANEVSSGSTSNTTKAYQDKKERKSYEHTYDNVEVNAERTEEFNTNYASTPDKTPAIETTNEFNTRSITTHERTGVREYGRKGGKTIAENFDDIMKALGIDIIEEITQVIMSGFMYYIYA